MFYQYTLLPKYCKNMKYMSQLENVFQYRLLHNGRKMWDSISHFTNENLKHPKFPKYYMYLQSMFDNFLCLCFLVFMKGGITKTQRRKK